jgi:hypothetical protein
LRVGHRNFVADKQNLFILTFRHGILWNRGKRSAKGDPGGTRSKRLHEPASV